MSKEIYIDIETYSSVNMKDSGGYRYFEAMDFEIMLVAYAFGGGDIKVVDLASGEALPEEFKNALIDDAVEKHAHNANFERNAFRAFGIDTPIEVWHCSMVKAAYCGLPLSLGALSDALKLEEKGKLSTGKALIRYFCMPCKPTKTNGGRQRNLPRHDPDKWAEFTRYVAYDVVAEREVVRLIKPYKLPSFERVNYVIDQEINDRGVKIDVVLARKAIEIDERHSLGILSEIHRLTNIQNPNSTPQLKDWIYETTGKRINSLAKDVVLDLIDEFGPGVVSTVLKLKQQVSSAAIKKYQKMVHAYCQDDRARGLLQFYGANRTGRWAGRLIQVQNLKRNYLKDLDTPRNLIKQGNYDGLEILYDIPSTLAQLVRTAFVAKEGHTFAVADFSAIEARVIAWLAKEQWRLDVFNSHGKIYEASAAAMFNVPIESVTKDSEYRSKGKIAELALGYQGSVGAMVAMGAEKEGLSEAEMRVIVKNWREASPNIVKLWYDLEDCAINAVRLGIPVKDESGRLTFSYNGEVLTIKLPSGRKLFYQKPYLGMNKFNKMSLKYLGTHQTTGKWVAVDTYGGKITENVVQAIARDLLAVSMSRLRDQGFKIVMHVHDESICEVLLGTEDDALEEMCKIMAQPISWAQGLPLDADGYTTPFYKKG